ncbi:MAG: branched-chain amino acid transaminase [Candidatus Baldrarchaeia archaeon]
MGAPRSKWIWMDGELVSWENAKVHVMTHALHYGSAVFEGIRCYKTDEGAAIFRLKEHIDRLFFSASIYRMKIPFTKEEIMRACIEVVKANEFEECYIRPLVYRGYGEMGVNPLNVPVKVAIMAWEWGAYLGKAQEVGARVIISTWVRPAPNMLPMMAKVSGHYTNSQLAKIEAVEKGADEAILLDHRGYISEGSGENIFIVKDEVIYTPPTYASILVGITRDSVMRIARDLGYTVMEKDITRTELYNADEAFFTGTAAEVTPIVEVDGIKIGDGMPGPITRKLQKAFWEVVHGKNKKYIGWLTFVR